MMHFRVTEVMGVPLLQLYMRDHCARATHILYVLRGFAPVKQESFLMVEQ